MAGQRRVCVVGALGRMGVAVRDALAAEDSLTLSAALEAPGHPSVGLELEGGVLLVDDAKAALAGCNVAIDFSVPQATLANLRAAADAGVAYVTGTTGFSDDEKAEIAALAERVPVIHAPNFSVAVNVLIWLTREAARKLGPGFDAEIVELHHAAKPAERRCAWARPSPRAGASSSPSGCCSSVPARSARDPMAPSASSPCGVATIRASTP